MVFAGGEEKVGVVGIEGVVGSGNVGSGDGAGRFVGVLGGVEGLGMDKLRRQAVQRSSWVFWHRSIQPE